MKLIDKKILLTTKIFDVEEVTYKAKERTVANMYRISCGDWANVLPVTPDKRAILIRQPRPGSLKYVLETPGGVIEKDEKDPTVAVARELEEETGFTSQRILSLGSFNPNPAMMTNRVHFFLALNAIPNPYRSAFPDENEQIDLEIINLDSLETMVRTGQIDHALSALCILLAQKYLVIENKEEHLK